MTDVNKGVSFTFFAMQDIARILRKASIIALAVGTVSTVTFVNKYAACLLLLFLRK